MLQELEEKTYSTATSTSEDFCDFNYDTACSGKYDVLDFSSFHIHDGPFPTSDENETLTERHYRNFKSEGDFSDFSQESEALNPYIQQDNLPDFNGYFQSKETVIEKSMGDPFWYSPAPPNFTAPAFPSYQLNDFKIRYTKEYLLNCRRSPLSRAFPDCLLKYIVMNELPLKQKKQEIRGDYRNMDHILFYNSLPFSRPKYTLENCFGKHLSI